MPENIKTTKKTKTREKVFLVDQNCSWKLQLHEIQMIMIIPCLHCDTSN